MKEFDLTKMISETSDKKLIPILEEMMKFVADVKPILESINISISENINKMPTATKKLSKVTEATEVATQEIMDVVDGIFLKTDSINKNLKNIKTSSTNEVHNDVDAADSSLQNINNDLTSIMMALQVQDITSQQLAAVSHLLNDIQNKLNNIISAVNASEFIKLIDVSETELLNTDNVEMMHRKIAFDPNAIDAFTSKGSRQQNVDDVLNKISDGTLTESDMNEEASVDDIDSMFANSNNNAAPSDADDVSQDDIDAMFNNK